MKKSLTRIRLERAGQAEVRGWGKDNTDEDKARIRRITRRVKSGKGGLTVIRRCDNG
jgi:hypothetical protein